MSTSTLDLTLAAHPGEKVVALRELVGQTVRIDGCSCGNMPWSATGVLVRCTVDYQWADDGNGETGPSPYIANWTGVEARNDDTTVAGLGLRLTQPMEDFDSPHDDDGCAYGVGDVFVLYHGEHTDTSRYRDAPQNCQPPMNYEEVEEIQTVTVLDRCGGGGVVIDSGTGGGYRTCRGCEDCEPDSLPEAGDMSTSDGIGAALEAGDAAIRQQIKDRADRAQRATEHRRDYLARVSGYKTLWPFARGTVVAGTTGNGSGERTEFGPVIRCEYVGTREPRPGEAGGWLVAISNGDSTATKCKAERTVIAGDMLAVVVYIRHADGRTVGLPTFYLNRQTQGIISTDHARRIVRTMLHDAGMPDASTANIVVLPV